MNGASGKSSPYISSDGPDSLDATQEDLFKSDSNPCVESSCSIASSSIEHKAISGLDVALSQDTDTGNANSECYDSTSESNCLQSELGPGEDGDAVLAADLDAVPDGGFDDIVAMEAEGDSQFEQTMAMLRDLSGSEVCSPSYVDSMVAEAEHRSKTETDLNGNCDETPTNDHSRNSIGDGNSALRTSALPASDAVQLTQHSKNLLGDRKVKGSSGFFNRCIENLLQRGLETVARSASPGGNESCDAVDLRPFSSADTSVRTSTSTSSRSHRKSRKPTKLSQMRLSEDVIIGPAKTPLPFHCGNCTFTCSSSSELNSHSSVCQVDVFLSNKSFGFVCNYCKTHSGSLEDFRNHLSHHVGDHTFHSFFCRYCDHSSGNMSEMDDHVTVHHPTEISRYEVSLEKVAYLQNMMECPVCGGSFLWKSVFVQHCKSDHHLEDLAAYLKSTFPDSPTPKSCKVSRQLFESFADILQTDSAAEDVVNTEMREMSADTGQCGGVTAKRLQCDRCSFTADSWEMWDRHTQEHHELAGDNLLSNDDGWSSTAPLVIDEDEGLTGISGTGFPESPTQKTFPSLTSTALGSGRSALEPEHNFDCGSVSVSKSLNKNSSEPMFPPGMEPELISENPASGELPQLMKIGSGRKGVKLRCRLCPFECYRTPNFRRHLAIHVHQAEYPESYRCAYCKFQHRRLNCIRFHLGKYHGQLPAKLSRVVRGKVVEVINADDVSLPAPKYGRSVPVSMGSFVPTTSSTRPLGTLPLSTKDYSMNKKDEVGLNANHEVSFDQTGSASSREKRMSKPPKRLSDSSDFQPPSASSISSWRMRRLSSDGMEDGGLAAAAGRLTGQARGPGGRPFDDNIAEDYIQSDLPPGMIYPEPIKCPRCSFTNRVRINLVRHMKQHHTEDLQQRNSTAPAAAVSPASSSEPSWMENIPAWARSQTTSQTSSGGTQSVVKNVPPKTLRDSGPSRTFGSYRYLPKPAPKLPNRLGSLSSADFKFTHGYLSSGRLEWNSESESYGRPKSTVVEARSGSIGGSPGGSQFLSGRVDGLTMTREGHVKRLFKCAYCSVSSRWNRRDISLHVLHVHVRRRAFRCRRCGYGTSKSAAAVTVHCARTHPGRPAIIEDNLTILNAILPLHMRPGVVLVAFRRSNGIPIMNLDELEDYFGLSKISTESSSEPKQDESIQSFSGDFHTEDPLLQYSGGAPLDLSAQLQKDTSPTVSQSVFPTPYHDIMSQDLGQTNHSGIFSFERRQSESSEKSLQLDTALISPNADRFHGESTGMKNKRPDSGPLQHATTTSSSSNSKDPSQFPPGTAFYRCRLCGYQDSRHDKTKYHVVREHLHLGPYGCAYCPRYMWGRRHVARHIAAVHPSMPVQIRRAFDEFETYLRENIRKIGGQPTRFPVRRPSQSPHGSSSATASVHPELMSTVETVPPLPVTQTLDPVKRKASFQCGHCEFRDALAAKVQGHCLAKHPSKPVRYRRCDEVNTSELTATGALAEVKIESVESLAFGEDFFSTPTTSDSATSSLLRDSRTHGDLSSQRSLQDEATGNFWLYLISLTL